jgi:hypothetical protein
MNYNDEERWQNEYRKKVYREHIKNCIKWAIIIACAMLITYFVINSILVIGLLLVK